ncbi:MAG: hypothetical protein M0R46_09955 [Candidatus Muirbacterium halophilum]|nr:hypothetical protein [Candidatus Muirbacterium halophilum]
MKDFDLGIYYIDKFKNGQFNKTESSKNKSESGKLISINDGDVTTRLYEMPTWFDNNDISKLAYWVGNTYGEHREYWIARYKTDEEGNISIQMEYDENSFESIENNDYSVTTYFIGDERNLLCSCGESKQQKAEEIQQIKTTKIKRK